MPRTLILAAVAVAGITLVAAGCGDDDDTGDSAGSGSDDARTVEIDMVDIAFEPGQLEVEEGETIRFVFTNRGELVHDAFIGDREAQDDHEADMSDAHEHGHDDEVADAVTVEPGDTGELTYTFDDSGTLEIGCHQPGHYDAGMKVTVDVA